MPVRCCCLLLPHAWQQDGNLPLTSSWCPAQLATDLTTRCEACDVMSNLDAYDNFASKIPVVPAWSQDQEKVRARDTSRCA